MHSSRAALLLIPSILATAWLIARFTSHDFVPTVTLMAGGALLAGFVHAMQGHWRGSLGAGRTGFAIAIGAAFRFCIGVSAIGGMIRAAMWATGVP